MEKSTAKQIIASRSLIAKEGKYRVKVTNVTPYHRDLGNGIAQVAIANFNAMSNYHLEAAKTLFGQGDYQEACNQNLSMSIRKNDYQPTKGEIVDIVVSEITTKNDVTGLFVISMSPVAASTAAKIDMGAFDELDTEERVALKTEEETSTANETAKAFK